MYNFKIKLMFLICDIISTSQLVEITDPNPLRSPSENLYIPYSCDDNSDLCNTVEATKENTPESNLNCESEEASGNTIEDEISELNSSEVVSDTTLSQLAMEGSLSKLANEKNIKSAVKTNTKTGDLERHTGSSVHNSANFVLIKFGLIIYNSLFLLSLIVYNICYKWRAGY